MWLERGGGGGVEILEVRLVPTRGQGFQVPEASLSEKWRVVPSWLQRERTANVRCSRRASIAGAPFAPRDAPPTIPSFRRPLHRVDARGCFLRQTCSRRRRPVPHPRRGCSGGLDKPRNLRWMRRYIRFRDSKALRLLGRCHRIFLCVLCFCPLLPRTVDVFAPFAGPSFVGRAARIMVVCVQDVISWMLVCIFLAVRGHRLFSFLLQVDPEKRLVRQLLRAKDRDARINVRKSEI